MNGVKASKGKRRVSHGILRLVAALCAAHVAMCSADDAFDFAAISRDRFGREDPSNPELVSDSLAFKPAKPTCWNAKAKRDEMSKIDVKSLSIVNGAEEDNYAMFIPASVADRIGGKGVAEWMRTTASQTVALPDANGGRYRLRLDYRADHTIGMANWNCYVVLAAGTNGFVYVNLPDTGDDSEYWIPREKEFDVPPGAKTLTITLRFDGAGYLRVARLGVKRCKEEHESAVSFLVKPYGLLDGRFQIESGDVGAMVVVWKRFATTKVQWPKDGVEIFVPRGFRLVGLTIADRKGKGRFRRERLADGSERIFSPMSQRCQPSVGKYNYQQGFGVLLRAEAPAGTVGRLSFRAIVGETQTGEEGGVQLESIAPAARVETPRDFLVGAMLNYDFCFFRTGDHDANEVYADFLVRRGVRWLMPQTSWLVEDRSLMPMWRRKGMRFVTPSDHDQISNGYHIRGTCMRPEADRFVCKPGMKDDFYHFKHSACPASIYEERPFFVTNVMPSIAERNLGADGMWVNWEPYYFKGCHCHACLERMKQWEGDPENFHSMQHGRLAVTVHRWMKKLFNPGKVGLAPAICWAEVASYARTHGYPADKLSKDYIGELDWLPAWGPYIGWMADSEAYSGIRGHLVETFLVAKDVREEIDRLYRKGKRPKLMGQSAGTYWSAIQPDWLEVSTSAYFFNRWEAVAPWVFPFGSDARYWSAYGRAVTRAARYESAVWNGERRDEATSLSYIGAPAKCAWPDKMFMPDTKDVPLLQQTTYDYNGSRYVACFNFNDESGAEFTLRTLGLKPGDYAVADEDGQMLFGGRAFGADELATVGVDLALPASQCRVFTFREIRKRQKGAPKP